MDQSIGKGKAPKKKMQVGVSVRDLIAAGLIDPPLQLKRVYKKRNLTAQVERDGAVIFRGESFGSLSVAAGMARKEVDGAPLGHRFPQTNGWTFWKFDDKNGQPTKIDVLRSYYLKRKRKR